MRKIDELFGMTITSLEIDKDRPKLTIGLAGIPLVIEDKKQDSCEHRYMVLEVENLDYYIGAKLTGIEVKQVTEAKEDGKYSDTHEIQFLEIQTDKGSFQFSSHNEHNGYYDGFYIDVTFGECSWSIV
jgi:hypothetical protein